MRTISHMPVVAGIAKSLPRALNSYVIFDGMREFANVMADKLVNCDYAGKNYKSWTGGMDWLQSIEACRNGDLSGVPIADKFMASVEQFANFETKKRAIVSDIVGGVPDVPAFLCGQPMHMRRSQRMADDRAPLVIVADLASSGGIEARDVQKRGAAVLALVRVLSAVRPVELWATCELDANDKGIGSSVATCIRIETSPLDLARAAHIMTHPSVPRALIYGYARHYHDSHVVWAYGDAKKGMEIQRKYGAESYNRIFAPGSECLYVPPIHLSDKLIANPVAWLKAMIAEYGWQGKGE